MNLWEYFLEVPELGIDKERNKEIRKVFLKIQLPSSRIVPDLSSEETPLCLMQTLKPKRDHFPAACDSNRDQILKIHGVQVTSFLLPYSSPTLCG